jgi:hypothetical protein
MSRGRLDLEIFWDGAAVTDVAIRNTRPQASRLLLGRTPREALAAIPLLFSLCRHGQTQAARQALAAAGGLASRENPESGEIALAAEAAQEHLWRLLLDWPDLLGLEPARDLLALWHRRLAEVALQGGWGDTGQEFAHFCERRLLDRDAAEWLAGRDYGQLGMASVCGALSAELEIETAPSRPTPTLPAGLEARTYYEGIAASLANDFARRPVWGGEPAETGSYARWRRLRPIVAGKDSTTAPRVLARLADLAFLALEVMGRVPARPRCGAFSPAPGAGFAVAETARGVLIHYARLERGRIADYLIVAPTEWNFHPAGAFRNGLVGFRAADAETLRRRAGRLALALDPCVAFDIAVSPAGPARARPAR